MCKVKKMYNCPQSCWRSVLFSCFWIIFSVLRSLSSWCTNFKALRIYCQTMGTKVCIIETWIVAEVITLRTCFSMFVYIHAHFHIVLIGGNLTAQSMDFLEVEFKFQRSSGKLSFFFLPRCQIVPESLLAG